MVALAGGVALALALVGAVVVVFWLAGGVPVLGVFAGAGAGVVALGVALSISGVK